MYAPIGADRFSLEVANASLGARRLRSKAVAPPRGGQSGLGGLAFSSGVGYVGFVQSARAPAQGVNAGSYP